jgi:hypothetical protein
MGLLGGGLGAGTRRSVVTDSVRCALRPDCRLCISAWSWNTDGMRDYSLILLVCGSLGACSVEGQSAREESSSVGDVDAGVGFADAEPGSPDLDSPPSDTTTPGPAFDPKNPLACEEASTLPQGVDTSVPTVGGYGVDAPNAELRALAVGMVGAWVGTQTSPWEPVRQVVIELHADGSYSASCEGGGCMPFYYGEFCPRDRGYWRLNAGNALAAFGEIRIFYEIAGTSTTEGLRQIRLEGEVLTFEQWHFERHGPIVFELERLR